VNDSTGRLILARHGETRSNRDGFIMGQSDSPLTPDGVLMARGVSQLLKTEKVRAIFSSTLGRAAFTAAIHSEALGAPVCFRDELAELSCGTWEGRSRVAVRGKGQLLRSSWTERPPGGESYEDAELRARKLVQEVAESGIPDTVLLVSHASVSRVYLKIILGLDVQRAIRVRFPHDTVYLLERDRTVRSRSNDGAPDGGLLWEPQ
jgi:broad specificity phosphatase PhoE